MIDIPESLGPSAQSPWGAPKKQFRNELLFSLHLPHFHGKTVADTHFEGGACHGFPAFSCLMFSCSPSSQKKRSILLRGYHVRIFPVLFRVKQEFQLLLLDFGFGQLPDHREYECSAAWFKIMILAWGP